MTGITGLSMSYASGDKQAGLRQQGRHVGPAWMTKQDAWLHVTNRAGAAVGWLLAYTLRTASCTFAWQ